MENKSYQLRYLPIFEQDLIGTANYITNVLKNEDAALCLIDDVKTAILQRLNNRLLFEPYCSAKKTRLSILSNLRKKLCGLLCGNR